MLARAIMEHYRSQGKDVRIDGSARGRLNRRLKRQLYPTYLGPTLSTQDLMYSTYLGYTLHRHGHLLAHTPQTRLHANAWPPHSQVWPSARRFSLHSSRSIGLAYLKGSNDRFYEFPCICT